MRHLEQHRAVIVLLRDGRYVSSLGYSQYDSMSEAREVASFMMRHHLLAEGVTAVPIRLEDFQMGSRSPRPRVAEIEWQ